MTLAVLGCACRRLSGQQLVLHITSLWLLQSPLVGALAWGACIPCPSAVLHACPAFFPACARAEQGTWHIYCTSAFSETQTDTAHPAVLDARIFHPPATVLSNAASATHPDVSDSVQLHKAWSLLQSSGAELQVQALKTAVTNASVLTVAAPQGLAPLSVLRPRLHQALVVPGSYFQLAVSHRDAGFWLLRSVLSLLWLDGSSQAAPSTQAAPTIPPLQTQSQA